MQLFLFILLFGSPLMHAISSADVGKMAQTKQQLDLLLQKEILSPTLEQIKTFESETAPLLEQLKIQDQATFNKYRGLVDTKKETLTLKQEAEQARAEIAQLKAAAAAQKPAQPIA